MRVVRDKTPGADVGVRVLRRKLDKSAQWWCPRHVQEHIRDAIRLSASSFMIFSGVFNPPYDSRQAEVPASAGSWFRFVPLR